MQRFNSKRLIIFSAKRMRKLISSQESKGQFTIQFTHLQMLVEFKPARSYPVTF